MALSKRNNDGDCNFSSPQHFSDLVIIVENFKFHVHKCILSMSSPVFEKMLTSDFREKDAKHIELPGKRRDEFGSFLKAIYSDIICEREQVDDSNYKFLLQLADEYEVSKVERLCLGFISSKTVTELNCLEIFPVAEKYNLEDVMEKCAEEASRKPRSVLETSKEFCGLKPENRKMIYAKQEQKLISSLENKYFTKLKSREDH